MKINNLNELMGRVKLHFTEYLEMFDTEFGNSHFTCPNRAFHKNEDNKPSASYYPNDEGFKCFSCEESGDIFSAAHFLEGKPLAGKEFITDNVLYLADVFGEEYEVLEMTEDELQREKLYKALEDTCMLSCKVLQSDNEKLNDVKEYINKRGWEGLGEDFDFGYCNYDKLVAILEKKGHTKETLIEAGLIPPSVIKGQYEKYLLHDRLLFPIRNCYGKIIAFGSRLIRERKNDDEQKYLQSRNTTLYTKTNVLFNLDKARTYESVYVVEGYADVFTLYKNELENCVALCGLSFNEQKYKLLVKNNISKIILCLDNDEAGINALNRIIDKELKSLSGIDVLIKPFPEDCDCKDVDEFINKYGIEEFKLLPELSVFDYKIEQLVEKKEDVIIKNDLIELIVNEIDYTKKERMSKKLAYIIDVSLDALSKEVTRHAKLGGKQLTTSEDILEEINCFERVVNDWDRQIWNRNSELLGLKADKFPIFTKKMDGIQNMFYLIAADTNVGKSALLLNLALDLIKSNDDVFVLFFSVDDSLSQLLPRMVALDIDMQINTVSNPKFKIQYNDTIDVTRKDKMILDRSDGVNFLKSISDRFAMKDESQAKKLEDIDKYIQIYKKIAGNKQLVVIIDNLHRITSNKKQETRELYMDISDGLKLWKTTYNVPVIATAEIKKTGHNNRPTNDDIKECKDLQFDADFVALLYSDFFVNANTDLTFNTDDTRASDDDRARPVIEMNVTKNKTSGFKKRLYYKFHPEYSKYEEMTQEETNVFFKKFTG